MCGSMSATISAFRWSTVSLTGVCGLLPSSLVKIYISVKTQTVKTADTGVEPRIGSLTTLRPHLTSTARQQLRKYVSIQVGPTAPHRTFNNFFNISSPLTKRGIRFFPPAGDEMWRSYQISFCQRQKRLVGRLVLFIISCLTPILL